MALPFEGASFKILQAADLHYTTLDAPDVAWTGSKPNGGRKTLDWFDRALELEKPDLVVFTGDNTTISPTIPALDTIYRVCSDREIPFAVILGNHDVEFVLTGREIMAYTQSFPYSVSQVGPEELAGAGNYFIDLIAKDQKTRMRLFFLDSHGQMPGSKSDWDYIKPDQIDWFKRHSSPELPSLVFFHIPPPQVNLMVDPSLLKQPIRDSERVPFEKVGEAYERPEPSSVDSGIYQVIREQGSYV
jgi:3',5'-cyclic AMP phosphodiesterase CpdA